MHSIIVVAFHQTAFADYSQLGIVDRMAERTVVEVGTEELLRTSSFVGSTSFSWGRSAFMRSSLG